MISFHIFEFPPTFLVLVQLPPQIWKHILFAILFTGGAFTVAAYFENKVAISMPTNIYIISSITMSLHYM